jgi:Mg-chelatase subunit ChlD
MLSRCILAAVALFALAAPGWAQALEVKAGSPLEIEKLTVRAEVDEGIALVDVDQVFRNHTDAVQEGVYRFRLPEKAVVHSFSMWMQGKEKQGRVLEARQARAIYDSIVRRKKDPALLEEIGWRRFQVSVFPIPARDTVRVRLVYAHVVDDDLGLRTLEIPLPEGTPVGVADVRVNVRDREGLSVLDCPTHTTADVLHDEALGAVRWSQEAYTASGPFRVRSAPATKGLGLASLAFRPAQAEDGTFLVRVVPRFDDVPELPRDVVFVVDRSGSMKGRKMEQAKAALRYGLSTLREGDRFSVIAFSSGIHEMAEGGLTGYDGAALEVAKAFTDSLTASGGTNIDGALHRAASLRSDDPGRLFVVSFLTDGNPTVGEKDPDRIVARYRDRSAGNVRLFAFGVGSDVKDFLLTRLAKDSRGAAEYVRENEDLEVKLSALFDKVRSPILTDVSVKLDGDDVQVLGVEPEVVPDVFRGTAVVVAGRYTGSGPANIRLTGRVGTAPVEALLAVDLPSLAAEKPHVAQLWARMRIDRLLDELRLHGMVPEIRDEIVQLGLKYQVVTPYTSFLVVEDGVHIPDDGELARVPEGPGGGDADAPRDGTAVHVFGRRADSGAVKSATDAIPPDSREPHDPPPPPSGHPTTPGGDTGGPTTGGGDMGPPATGGHGGSYRGPVGEVPPDSREPSDPPPAAVGGAAGPKTGGAGRPSSARKHPGYSWWRFWWETHRASLYRIDRRAAPSLSDEVRDQVVLSALRDVALDSRTHFALRRESQRALALWGDDSPDVRELAVRMLEGKPRDGEPAFHRVNDESAPLLFLNERLDGADRARLLSVLEDPRRDRTFVRPYAALVLGLGGPDPSGDTMKALIAASTDSHPRGALLRPSAILALGLLGDQRAIPVLAAMLDDPLLAQLDRAYVVEALGRLRAQDLLPELLAALENRRTDTLTRRSLPGAVARIAVAADPSSHRKAVATLGRVAQRDKDTSVRQLACIAMARIAADTGVAERARQSAVKSLRYVREKGKPRSNLRPYAELGLALVARIGDEQALEELALGNELDAPDLQASWLAAQAVAGDDTSAAHWVALARDRGEDPHLREIALDALAYAAVVVDVEPLRWSLATASDDAERARLCIALAAHGDTKAREQLLTLVEGGEASERVFEMLGRVGGDAEARRLASVVLDEGRVYSDWTRAMAARALGRMSGAPDLRQRISESFPYRAFSPPIWELMDHWR